MNRDTLIIFINNTVLLLVLAILYDFLPHKTKVNSRKRKIIAGIVVGCVGIAVMVASFRLTSGIFFDTRWILLSLTGLFLGGIPTAIAVLITTLFRFYAGGQGAWTGSLTIVVAATLGVLWRHYRSRWFTQYTWLELYGFGLVVQVFMLLCMFTLPRAIVPEVLRTITLPILIVFPLGTMLLGMLLARQLESQQLEEKLEFQAGILGKVSDAVIITDMDFRIQSFNRAAEKLYGWSATEVTGHLLRDIVKNEYINSSREVVIHTFLTEGMWQGDVWQMHRDGSKLYIRGSITLLKDDNDSPVGVIGINRDMTQYKQVENQNRLLLKLTTAVAEAIDLDSAWQVALTEICESADWAVGEIWLLSADQQQLVIDTPSYYQTDDLKAFSSDWESMKLSPDSSLPSKVWAAKKADWVADIGELANFNRAEAAEKAGLSGNICIPILDNHEVVAVMNFLLTRNPTPEDKQMMDLVSSAAAQLGTAVKRKQIEDRLYLQSAALAAAANAIVILNKNGLIEWGNPAFTTLTGYSESEMAGKNLGQLVSSGMQDQTFYRNLWDTILAGNVWHSEIINRRKDGTHYHEEETITPVRDDKNNISHFIAIKQDITARKAYEADRARLMTQIQEQAERIQHVIDTVPTGVLVVDAHGHIQLTNPVAKDYLNTLTHLDGQDQILYFGDQALEELLIPLPEEKWHEVTIGNRVFETIASPITQSDNPNRWVLVINELTQDIARQRYEQAQEQLAIVGQLSAGIAHDFNNIMGVIMIYAQMLQELPNLSQDSYKRLETINNQAQHASALISQILDFSHRSGMSTIVLDVLPIIKELIKLLERTLGENIKLSLDYNEKVYKINADPTRIQQAMMNLAINARDAMPHGGELQFELAYYSVQKGQTPPLPNMASGDWVQLTIRDSGEGILPENILHIFEPFFTTKAPGRGTGLGLAQVYNIISQHKGHIDVQSKLGEGTIFTIYLPLADVPDSQPPSLPIPEDLPSGDEVILLVEDNVAMRRSIQQALVHLGYKILLASNGAEALRVLADNSGAIDLVLSDIVMPNMGGMTLLQCLRKDYLSIKILVMSGHIFDEDEVVFLTNEQIPWLAKPFNVMTLAMTLRDALDS